MTDLVFTLHIPFHFEVPVVSVILGAVVGLSYALLAFGLILVYRSTRIINLAHGEVGALAAAIVAVLVNERGWSYPVAALLSLVLAGALGAGIELLVIRRLFAAPRLMVLVATMGVAQLFLFFTFLLNDSIDNRLAGFPAPFPMTATLGALVLQPGELLLLVVVPLVAAGLAAFFRLTGFGVAVRAAAENADSARLVGIPTRRISTFVWAAGAVLAATTALMLAPGRGLTVTESLGPDLLMRALAAAALARMASLPKALVAGISIGVIEKTVAWNYSVGVVELVLFLVLLAALLLQENGAVRDVDASTWRLSTLVRPLPRAVAALPAVRRMPWIATALALAAAVAIPEALSNSDIYLLTTVVCFAIVGLSVLVLTGYGGQMSLGQVALFGLGAGASYQLTVELHVPFWLALVLSGLAGSAVAVLIGLPALRIRGLFLAVTTLAFALVAQKWLLQQDWLIGAGRIAPRPYIGPIDFRSQQAYYYLALGGLAFAVLVCRNVLRSGIGRNLLAVRDNDQQAAAFTLPVTRTKLMAFAVSGFLAAFGGAIYGHGVQTYQVANFPVADSLRVVAMTIIGGLGSIPGTIIGATLVVGMDRLVDIPYLRLLSTSVGLLALLLYLPGGLGQIVYGVRDRLAAAIAKRSDVCVVDAAVPAGADDGLADIPGTMPPGSADRVLAKGSIVKPLLTVDGVEVRYGGVRALDGVSLQVGPGEVVGLIGPNGAGKTTLFECIAGFNAPQAGRIAFAGADVTRERPDQRAVRGLVRSFQDARLFESLTVFQTVLAAQEKASPTRLLPSLLSLPRTRSVERAREVAAADLIDAMGLTGYGDALISELSTGTRRITELACVLALRPTLLLLDEPSSGIAQREVEALGRVLRSIQATTGCTMLIIEHDMPLIMDLADRIVALESGRLLAEGTPAQIRRHPEVIRSYLGSTAETIDRSGTVGANEATISSHPTPGARRRRPLVAERTPL